MKKIYLSFIFLFSVLFSFSQTYPVNQYIGAPNTLVTSKGGFKVDSSLILPYFADTSNANISPYIKNYPGALIRVVDSIFMRNNTATAWIKFSSGGGGGGGNFWSLVGNAGTTSSNFLGTTDNQALRFRVNNTKSGIIDSANKNVSLGYGTLK